MIKNHYLTQNHINLLLKVIESLLYLLFSNPNNFISNQMGTNTSIISPTTLSFSTLFKKYQIVQKNDQKCLTIVKEKQSQNSFIIKELTFIEKSTYQKNLCRFNHFQQVDQSENILNLKKVWTEEHNTLCSNTFKIYAMYEYSNVTLKDELQARRNENKYFEEDQILGIIQSGINCLNSQEPILISPSEYYIDSDGMLKLNNSDLFDYLTFQNYTKGVYYSPQKMQNFQIAWFSTNSETLLKQSIFSLGITLLNCICLEDLSDKIYNPLHLNKKIRFNYSILEKYLNTISCGEQLISEKLTQLLKKMLDKDIKVRPNTAYIQEQLDQIVRLRQQIVQKEEQRDCDNSNPQNKMTLIQIQDDKQNQVHQQQSEVENLSTIYQKFGKNPLVSQNKQFTEDSQLQILRQITSINVHLCNNRGLNDQRFNVKMIDSINPQSSRAIQESLSKSKFSVEELPCPVSQHNPLFTSPQFLAKINQDIRSFAFTRNNSLSQTQMSRKNSNADFFKCSSLAKIATKSKPNIGINQQNQIKGNLIQY